MSYADNPNSSRMIPPLGVHLVEGGVTAAVFASHATAVELCLLDPISSQTPENEGFGDLDAETKPEFTERRVSLTFSNLGIWHAFVPDVTAGQRYGFRVSGSWDPVNGHRYNPNKLLTDPYARGLTGNLDYGQLSYGQVLNPEDLASSTFGEMDQSDNQRAVPHSVVVAPLNRDSQSTRPASPNISWARTIVYEAHVKGLTQNHPEVPEEQRGTYAALGHPAVVQHLTDLGITTLELLPIHFFTSEPHLIEKDLINYWGYNTLGFFAPHEKYATVAAQVAGPQAVIDELRTAIDALHSAGIEVVLDVVYNHTAEGGVGGQHLAFKGFDNSYYYMHDGSVPAQYADVTGCGNSLDFRRPRVVQLALDSMRYWLEEIGVDGFRLDLAVTLGRTHDGFTPEHPFLVALQTDPVISQAKIIAEPWDVGPGGWQTGGFPIGVSEWNDRFRNSVRAFWLSDARALSHSQGASGIQELATRLSGSADLFGHTTPPLLRGPMASINFVTAHDGFTLADLVSYDHKHNEANGEDSRDGTNDNRSWNHGVEGPLKQEDMWHVIAPLRRRSMRNMLASLILSAGVPMITAGDEYGRTQQGNNNAYCQDSTISWFDWEFSAWRQDLVESTKFLINLRNTVPAVHVGSFFTGQPLPHDEEHQPDLAWYNASGTRLTVEEWVNPGTRVFSMFRRGRVPDIDNDESTDPHVLLAFNGMLDDAVSHLPEAANSTRTWRLAWCSSWDSMADAEILENLPSGAQIELEALSMQIYLADPLA